MSQPVERETGAPSAPKTGRGKLIAIVVTVLVLVAIGAAAVYYLSLPAGPTGTIKVGFTIALTGRYTVEGTNSLRGIETAANWINSHGGITVQGKLYNISLVYYDDQSLQSNVVSLYSQIIEQDGAQFLLAPYTTALTTTAAPIADQYDRVMMSHGGAADTIWTQTTRRNLVEVLSPASAYLKGAVDWLDTNHPADQIAVLHENDAFSTLAAWSAIAYAQSLGLSVVYNQSYATGTTDLSPQLNAAQAAGRQLQSDPRSVPGPAVVRTDAHRIHPALRKPERRSEPLVPFRGGGRGPPRPRGGDRAGEQLEYDRRPSGPGKHAHHELLRTVPDRLIGPADRALNDPRAVAGRDTEDRVPDGRRAGVGAVPVHGIVAPGDPPDARTKAVPGKRSGDEATLATGAAPQESHGDCRCGVRPRRRCRHRVLSESAGSPRRKSSLRVAARLRLRGHRARPEPYLGSRKSRERRPRRVHHARSVRGVLPQPVLRNQSAA